MIDTNRFTAFEVITIRKSLYLSQTEFANLLGVKQQVVARWEKENYSPNTTKRCKIARLYESIYKQAMVFVAKNWAKEEVFFVVYPENIEDTSAKRIAYVHLMRKNVPTHLIIFDEQDYKKTYFGIDRPSVRTTWAKDYYKSKRYIKERKPRGLSEYPWLSEWD